MPCLFTRLSCSPLDTLRPVKMLAAPALCGAKPDEVDTDRRRADVVNRRAHEGGGRAVPRPAAIHSETLVTRCFGAAHGVSFKICWRQPRCTQRKPTLPLRIAGANALRRAARNPAAPRLRHPPPRKTRRRGPVALVRGVTGSPSRSSLHPAARNETRHCRYGPQACP